MKDINKEEWKKAILKNTEAVIIDVRTSEEVEQGYIPEAKHIDIYDAQNFMEEINKLDKSKAHYVYCKSGGRSAQACTIMDQMGFEETYNLTGGFSQWDGEKIVLN